MRAFHSAYFSRRLFTKLSHVHGDTSTKLIADPIGAVFDAQVANHANDLALVVKHQHVRWTYEEFQHQVNATNL